MEFHSKVLAGRLIHLEPIGIEHLEELQIAAADSNIWRFIPFALNESATMKHFVAHATTLPTKGEGQAYAIRHLETKKIIGGSGYWHVDHHHRKLEIGGSWIMLNHQRSGANTEAKYLLLSNAFEVLGCDRVGFSIDARNEKSIKAIERIGATREGVLRNDMRMHDGSARNSAIYSIVRDEWPKIKAHIERLRGARP